MARLVHVVAMGIAGAGCLLHESGSFSTHQIQMPCFSLSARVKMRRDGNFFRSADRLPCAVLTDELGFAGLNNAKPSGNSANAALKPVRAPRPPGTGNSLMGRVSKSISPPVLQTR